MYTKSCKTVTCKNNIRILHRQKLHTLSITIRIRYASKSIVMHYDTHSVCIFYYDTLCITILFGIHILYRYVMHYDTLRSSFFIDIVTVILFCFCTIRYAIFVYEVSVYYFCTLPFCMIWYTFSFR